MRLNEGGGGTNRIVFGDCRESMRAMIAEGVKCQMVCTSPPYWNLRSYLADGHEDKHREIGLEPTMQAYIANMVYVFSLVWELLDDSGVLFLNLGDSYLPGKQLAGMPWRVAFALQEAGWYLRQDIIWAKPSAMPESVTDRCTKSHEYVFLLSKSERYFFDYIAIQEKAVGGTPGNVTHKGKTAYEEGDERMRTKVGLTEIGAVERRNKRSVWTVNSQGFSGSHFAVFPEALISPMVLAGTSQRGHCPACLARWVRVVERESFGKAPSATKYDDTMQAGPLARSRQAYRAAGMEGPPAPKTIGWKPSCQCGLLEPVQDIVFDPFMGSGTTARVSEKLGRRWLGCELQGNYGQLIKTRTAQMGLRL